MRRGLVLAVGAGDVDDDCLGRAVFRGRIEFPFDGGEGAEELLKDVGEGGGFLGGEKGVAGIGQRPTRTIERHTALRKRGN
jgi:hypothetical protein